MDHRNCFIILCILIAFVLFTQMNREGFDPNGMEFLPPGVQRYGLRGEPLRQRPISDYYISPNRNIRLSSTAGLMYESNTAQKGGRKVACPNDGYDNKDTCWMYGNMCQGPNQLRDIKWH